MPRPDDEPVYSLDELTARAETTPRTVRYYIAEGLLPPAVSAGPKSGYTAVHLDRLRLINRMKDAYLPLREIRQRIGSLNDDEISETLRALDREGEAAPTPPLTTAADYIAGLIADQTAPQALQSVRLADPGGPVSPAHDTWRRLPISSEAELLIRDEAYRRRADQIDTLITWARRMLS